jgi:hypothetical protein
MRIENQFVAALLSRFGRACHRALALAASGLAAYWAASARHERCLSSA